MKALRVISLLILVFTLAGTLPAAAQGPVNVSVDGLELDDFPNVRVLVTVRNENGVPIGALGASNFELVEDGARSFPPTEVTTQVNPDETISIVMVIDISGSMEGKPITEAIRAANALIDQLSPDDQAAIIAFADEVDLDPTVLAEGKELGFTTDKNALRNVVNFLDGKIGWDTPLYDGIYKGVKLVAAQPPGKRAVVVMTDGRDERDNRAGVPVPDAGSLSSPDDPINEANRHNIPIFSVGLVGLGGRLNSRYLERLAERTGGIYQEAPQPEELTPLFENVVNQLREQYVLGYRSELEEDDEYHSLVVRVQLPQGQGFDEIKFRIKEEEAPTATSPAPAATVEGPAPATTPGEEAGTPEPSPTPLPPAAEEEDTWLQGVLDQLRERPALAVVIGAGILLLFALLAALVIVLLRSRGGEEEVVPGDYDSFRIPTSATPDWTPGPFPGGGPDSGAATAGPTEAVGDEWSPAPRPAPGPTPGGLPPAGLTVAIERGPKHLAMLVNKARPEKKHDVRPGTMNVGRAKTNQIIIDDPTVSRHHAWIKVDADSYLIFDVGSSNGTFVNDEPVEEPRYLEDGDRVRFGEAEFHFTKVF